MSVRSKLELELGVDMVVEIFDTLVAKVGPGKSVIQHLDALVQGIIDLRVLSEWRSMWVINNEW